MTFFSSLALQVLAFEERQAHTQNGLVCHHMAECFI